MLSNKRKNKKIILLCKYIKKILIMLIFYFIIKMILFIIYAIKSIYIVKIFKNLILL